MLMIPGSHKLGLQNHVLLGRYREEQPEPDFEGYNTQIDPAALNSHLSRAVDVPANPGDLVLFTFLTMHSNQPNK